MRVLTITFHRSKNYGAALQAYALQNALKKSGYDTAIIDFSRVVDSKKGKTLKGKLRLFAIKILDFLHRRKRKRFILRFEDFVAKRLLLTERYQDYSSLQKSPPVADMYLIGSDQVWNITYRYRPEFFADFAPNSIT